MLIERKIRSIIEKYPLKDKQMQDVMERWMIYLAEEIVESIEEKQNKLATKDDLKQVIELMNARFEAQQKETNALRQEMNARFEALQKTMDERFAAQQKETNALRQEMNARFEALQKTMDERFAAMDARFEAQQKETNALRQEMNARFEALEKRLGFMQWLIGGGVLLMLLKLFFPHFFPQ